MTSDGDVVYLVSDNGTPNMSCGDSGQVLRFGGRKCCRCKAIPFPKPPTASTIASQRRPAACSRQQRPRRLDHQEGTGPSAATAGSEGPLCGRQRGPLASGTRARGTQRDRRRAAARRERERREREESSGSVAFVLQIALLTEEENHSCRLHS